MEENMVKAVVGANWGDEGKGKITDMLAEKADIIVRFQGGANAGHTIVNNYGKFALHTLPSGVFYNHTTSVIGNGVALNIPILMKEIKSITDRNVPMRSHGIFHAVGNPLRHGLREKCLCGQNLHQTEAEEQRKQRSGQTEPYPGSRGGQACHHDRCYEGTGGFR
jgi:hypothetical protein